MRANEMTAITRCQKSFRSNGHRMQMMVLFCTLACAYTMMSSVDAMVVATSARQVRASPGTSTRIAPMETVTTPTRKTATRKRKVATKKTATSKSKSKTGAKKTAAKKKTALRRQRRKPSLAKSKAPTITVTAESTATASPAAEETEQRRSSLRRSFPTHRTEQDVYQSMHSIYFENGGQDDFDISSFQELQRSTGPEIVDEGLQTQIDQVLEQPIAFLNAQNASRLEMIAMSSIPQQLPQPVMAALGEQRLTSTPATVPKSKGKPAARLAEAGIETSSSLKDKATARLTPEREIELGKMIQAGVALEKMRDDHGIRTRQEWAKMANTSVKELRRTVASYRSAKQYLVQANMGLVHVVVKQQFSRKQKASGITYDELVQEGSLGLIRAAELFDPTKGLRFSTYATIWIKGQLSNSSAGDLLKIPLREKAKYNKIYKAEKDLQSPSIHEIAEHTNLKPEEIHKIKLRMSQAKRPLSLDYTYRSVTSSGTDTGSLTSERFLADEDLAERTQMRADVVAAMTRNLDAREARLMRLRYGLHDGQMRSLSQCAEAMGLSQTRVQQLSQQCLKKLRAAKEAESLQEYLLSIA